MLDRSSGPSAPVDPLEKPWAQTTVAIKSNTMTTIDNLIVSIISRLLRDLRNADTLGYSAYNPNYLRKSNGTFAGSNSLPFLRTKTSCYTEEFQEAFRRFRHIYFSPS
jgi:hypothetical protein